MQVPVWAVAAGLGCVAFAIFAAVLALSLGGSLYGNRLRRAVRGGNREAAGLCAAYLRNAARRSGDDAFFSDDPSSAALEALRRDLAWAGVKASVAEMRQYLVVSGWAGARRSRAIAGRIAGGARRAYRIPRVGTTAAGF